MVLKRKLYKQNFDIILENLYGILPKTPKIMKL